MNTKPSKAISRFQGLNLTSNGSSDGTLRPLYVFLAITTIGMAVSGGVFRYVHQESQSESRLGFEREASQIAADMETSFNLGLEHLRSIPPFFAGSDEVTRQDFQKFVSPALQRHSSLYVSAFLPRVPAAEKIAFELAAREEGFDDYVIRSVDANGQQVALPDRDYYFPIYFNEPLVPEVPGIDLASHPEQARFVEMARRTDQTVVTPPLSLIEDPPNVLSVIAFNSVDFTAGDDCCGGIALVIVRIRPLVENALGSTRLSEYQIVLTDPDANQKRQFVYKNFPGDMASIHKRRGSIAERKVSFADQQWAVTLSPAPGSKFAPAQPPYWVFGIGIPLTLLAGYCFSANMQIGGLRKQVNQFLELGQYQLGKKLGEGGMGSVYEATHHMLARPAAIKLIRSEDETVERSWQHRFEREAQATAALQSPHTVTVYDFGKTRDGTFYYVMERLDGADLATLVKATGPLSPARTVCLLRQICHSLAEAHEIGLIHRDIKPANIFVCKQGLEYDHVKVLDFGLVKTIDQVAGSQLTFDGKLIGTPAYMAPEMIQCQPIDGRTDIYSLGCVAYWLLTGKQVFEGSLSAIIAGHVAKPPPVFQDKINTKIPVQLQDLIKFCLAKDPNDRPQSAEELEKQLAVCSVQPWTQVEARESWHEYRVAMMDNTSDHQISQTVSRLDVPLETRAKSLIQ